MGNNCLSFHPLAILLQIVFNIEMVPHINFFLNKLFLILIGLRLIMIEHSPCIWGNTFCGSVFVINVTLSEALFCYLGRCSITDTTCVSLRYQCYITLTNEGVPHSTSHTYLFSFFFRPFYAAHLHWSMLYNIGIPNGTQMVWGKIKYKHTQLVCYTF